MMVAILFTLLTYQNVNFVFSIILIAMKPIFFTITVATATIRIT